MSGVPPPSGFRWERLLKSHPRRNFTCGESEVDHWLRANAWQHQQKHLSVTRVLLNEHDKIAGYYTLATGQVNFDELPSTVTKKLPQRKLPVAVLAWLGVATEFQGQGLGKLLLAAALRDCFEAGDTFAFIAVILDCLNDSAKSFYQQWEFREVPGYHFRLCISYAQLAKMMES